MIIKQQQKCEYDKVLSENSGWDPLAFYTSRYIFEPNSFYHICNICTNMQFPSHFIYTHVCTFKYQL